MDSEQTGLTPPAPPRRGATGRFVIALILLAFIGGLALMAWAMTQWHGGSVVSGPSGDPLAQNSADDSANLVQPPRPAYPPLSMDAQTARVIELEQRMTRVAVSAQSAASYASRAEAMMVAFSARRALDAGSSLERIEPQLRLLFGQAQPKAVATIVNAAAEPVTIPILRQGLEEVGAIVARGNPGESWWQSMTREVGSLVVIRRAGTASPAPQQRLARARLDVESGQIDAAIAELEALRQQPQITAWLEQARRYNEAHRALDVIEAAAMLEARGAPVVTVPPPALQPNQPPAGPPAAQP